MPASLTNLWTTFTDWLGLSDPLYLSILAATLILGSLATTYTLAWPTLRPPIRATIQRLRKRTPQGLWCKHCGFDLSDTHTNTADTNPCPECGRRNTARAGTRPLIWKRRWITGITALLIFSAGVHLYRERYEYHSRDWAATLPTTALLIIVDGRAWALETPFLGRDAKPSNTREALIKELRHRAPGLPNWQADLLLWRAMQDIQPHELTTQADPVYTPVSVANLVDLTTTTDDRTWSSTPGVRVPKYGFEWSRVSPFLHYAIYPALDRSTGQYLPSMQSFGFLKVGRRLVVVGPAEAGRRTKSILEHLDNAPPWTVTADEAFQFPDASDEDGHIFLLRLEELQERFDNSELQRAIYPEAFIEKTTYAGELWSRSREFDQLGAAFFGGVNTENGFIWLGMNQSDGAELERTPWYMVRSLDRRGSRAFERLMSWLESSPIESSAPELAIQFDYSASTRCAVSFDTRELFVQWKHAHPIDDFGLDWISVIADRIATELGERVDREVLGDFFDPRDPSPADACRYSVLGNRLIIFSPNDDRQQIIDALNELRATWQAAAPD